MPIFGGTAFGSTYFPPGEGKYSVEFSGGNYDVLFEGSSVQSGTFTRGVTSELTATTVIGARHGGSNSTYGFYYGGIIRNVGIRPLAPTVFNAALFPINDNASTIADSLGGIDANIVNYDPLGWEVLP